MWVIDNCHLLIVFVLLLNPFCFYLIQIDVRYCGFEQSCTQNGSGIAYKNKSCCLPCQCADVCKEKNTCCHDKEGRDDRSDVIPQECISSVYLPNITLDHDLAAQSYFARTRCPFSFNNSHIKGKCENDKPESLQELVIVSSRDGKVIYKNKFCAVCHQEQNVVSWEINALKINRCRELLSKKLVNIVSATKFVLQNCFLSFKRPSNVNIESVYCTLNNVINKCNETGMWDVYDMSLERLCLNPQESVYFHKQRLYKNLYCYLCNSAENVEPMTCTRFLEREPGNTFAITNLLQWEAKQSTSHNECKVDEIYDIFFGRCKTLHCPKMSFSANGQCIQFVDIGLSYLLTLKLVPYQSLRKSDSIYRALRNQLPIIQRQFGLGECDLCTGMLFIEENNDTDHLDEINIRLALKQTKECTTKSMLSLLTLIERNEMTVMMTLDGREYFFNALLDFKKELPKTEIMYTFGQTGYVHSCLQVTFERHLYCPKIQLTMTEYRDVLENHSNVKDLFFQLNKDGENGTVFVCIQNYLSEQHSTVLQISISPIHIVTATILFHQVV